ncbi:hypothetical protein ACO2Q3_07355 [Caulobacter sp. KR2-114]|uniref:hypothetical protein n=1 Tax=Caulobacter sp. KR2-114 TaxID=3400912 RepID=UPI003C09ABD7
MLSDTPLPAHAALTLQFLAWVAERPRTYAEAMEARRTSCPRLSVWEDCRDAGLVAVRPRPGGMAAAAVELTAAGAALAPRG